MTDVTIRQAGPSDKPFLQRMQWLAILASPGLVDRLGQDKLREMEERTWAEWPQLGETAFIADSADGVPLGAVLLRAQEHDGERIVGYRLAIAVDTYARGRGLGRLLMQYAAEFAASGGSSYVCLEVDPANSVAIRLYRSEGYVDGDEPDVLWMTLRLDGDARGKT